MGKIYYLMGKSASGKDHIYENLIQETALDLKPFVLYTTRPIRSGEQDGREYFFVDEKRLSELREAGKIIEERMYSTVQGPWYYFTADDGQIPFLSAIQPEIDPFLSSLPIFFHRNMQIILTLTLKGYLPVSHSLFS